MSNSIWKMREKKPKSFSFILEHYNFNNNKDINAYRVFKTGWILQNPFDGNTIRWCYLDDLIAQADKAERLQKAVDYALQVLDNLTEIGGIDLEMIKIEQLIKETTNEK